MIDINGNNKYREIWLGDRSISELYYGDHKIWPENETPVIDDCRYIYKLMDGTSGVSYCGSYGNRDNYLFGAYKTGELFEDSYEYEILDNYQYITELIVGNCIDQLSFVSTPSAKDLTRCYLYDFTRCNATVLPGSFFATTSIPRDVLLGETFTKIDNRAFRYSSTLVNIQMPKITEIGDYAFEGTSLLGSITIPSTLMTIGNDAFRNSKILTNVYNFENCKVASISNNVFMGCSLLENIKLGINTRSVLGSAFQDCISLKSMDLSYVTELGLNAFMGCSAMTEVIFNDDLQNINNGSFQNCSSLDNVKLPKNLLRIGGGAFNTCSGITSEIEIPESVTTIEYFAFTRCSNVKSYKLLSKIPPNLGDSAFNYDSGCPIYVPCDSVDAYKSATNWSNYADRIVGYDC